MRKTWTGIKKESEYTNKRKKLRQADKRANRERKSERERMSERDITISRLKQRKTVRKKEFLSREICRTLGSSKRDKAKLRIFSKCQS